MVTMKPGSSDVASLAVAASLFRSLGDSSRLAILAHLMLGEHRVVELTEHVGLAQSTVSAHLRCLLATTGDAVALCPTYGTGTSR